jgi:hypothetical protein
MQEDSVKRFNVAIPREDGGVELYPMKEWLRHHPEQLPVGLNATLSTSHELRNGLKKVGWSVQNTDNEVRLIVPGRSVEAVLGSEEEPTSDDPSEATFALEKQLQDFLAQNLDVIPVDGKKLRLYVDATGRDGIEYETAVGRIDILAVDDTEAFVIFELKRARSPDHAIGQLARYMGWVKQTIGKDKRVRGVIVAKTIGENLRYAINAMPDVSLFAYEVSFELKAVLNL